MFTAILTGVICATASALSGGGAWIVALWYVIGCWCGFLFSVIALLTMRPGSQGRYKQHQQLDRVNS